MALHRVIFVLIFTVCPIISIAQAPTGYPFVSYDIGLENAQKSGRNVFVYYGRTGCGFCDMTNQHSFSKAEIRERYIQHYELVYINSESGDRLTLPNGEVITEMQFGERMQAVGTPVFLVLNTQGHVLAKVYGYQKPEIFLKLDHFIQHAMYNTTDIKEFLYGQ